MIERHRERAGDAVAPRVHDHPYSSDRGHGIDGGHDDAQERHVGEPAPNEPGEGMPRTRKEPGAYGKEVVPRRDDVK